MKKIFAIYVGIALLWSCESHDVYEVEVSIPVLPEITIKKGVLSFESMDSYRALVNEAEPSEKIL